MTVLFPTNTQAGHTRSAFFFKACNNCFAGYQITPYGERDLCLDCNGSGKVACDE